MKQLSRRNNLQLDEGATKLILVPRNLRVCISNEYVNVTHYERY